MEDGPPEPVIENLSDGVGDNLRCQTSEQAPEGFRSMAFQGEEIFELVNDAFDELLLLLSSSPPSSLLRPRSPGVLLRGGGSQGLVGLPPVFLPRNR